MQYHRAASTETAWLTCVFEAMPEPRAYGPVVDAVLRYDAEALQQALALDPGLASVPWAANKRFKILNNLKFNFQFPRARTFELFRARSRLYRSQILQLNTRLKARDAIYKIYTYALRIQQFG